MYREFGISEAIYILLAVRWTVLLALIAFCGGAIFGLIIALMRASGSRAMRFVAAVYVRINQGTPLLIQLFLVFFGLSMLGLELSAMTAAAICLIMNAAAFLGETWRGCIQAIGRGQIEAASAIGLGYFDTQRYVVLPQAARIAMAPTVSCLVYSLKSTSLASLIGFVELTRAASIVNNSTSSPFLIFGLISVIYFLLCWPLSRLSTRLEKRFAR